MPEISVQELFDEQKDSLALELVAGAAGLDNRITNARLQKYSLAFTGYFEYFHPDRVQVLGKTEVSYLATLPEDHHPHGEHRGVSAPPSRQASNGVYHPLVSATKRCVVVAVASEK
ncbi:MAG: hypothetical protein ACE5IM_08500, partial [Nitrospinota bacterium]